MMLGADPFTAVPTGVSEPDFSVLPDVVDLISDQESARAYLFHATPYDPTSQVEVDVRASIGLRKPILDSAAWPATLDKAADVQIDLFGDTESAQGQTNFGNLQLFIGSGDYDAITAYYWDGRDVEVKLGSPDGDYADYVTVLKGTAQGVTYNERALSVVFRGKEEFFDKAVQETLYAGTGGLEGSETIESTEKPLGFGLVRNVTPVLVGSVTLVYQVHDGSMEGVLRAMDGGVELRYSGDVDDISAATVAPGYYKTSNATGFIKLGAKPEKQLTVDFRGGNSGGYVDTAPEICKRIILDYTDLTEADINLAAVATASLDSVRAACGIYIQRQTVMQVLTELMASVGGAWTFDSKGLWAPVIFRKRRPAGVISNPDIVSLERRQTPPPVWRRSLGYARSWTVQTDDQFLGSASDEQRAFATNEYRRVNVQNATLKASRKSARLVTRDTLLTNGPEAQVQAAKERAIFGSAFERFDVVAKRQQFRYQAGQTVTVNYDRFSISRDMIILGVREDTGTQRTTLRLWGESSGDLFKTIVESVGGAPIIDPSDGSVITEP